MGESSRGERPPAVDTFAGCLLGGALGDALGYPVELETSTCAITRRHGEALDFTEYPDG